MGSHRQYQRQLRDAWKRIGDISARHGTPHHMLQAACGHGLGGFYNGTVSYTELDEGIASVRRVAGQMLVPVQELEEAMLAFRRALQLYRTATPPAAWGEKIKAGNSSAGRGR